VAGTKGVAWIQSGAVFGDPEQVWVQDAAGAREIGMPAELVNPAPEPFPVGELVKTEMDRWHSQGFDSAPYAKLFGQVNAVSESCEAPLPEPYGDFNDAAAGQAVLNAARRSRAERR
jgi:hypothetical protein